MEIECLLFLLLLLFKLTPPHLCTKGYNDVTNEDLQNTVFAPDIDNQDAGYMFQHSALTGTQEGFNRVPYAEFIQPRSSLISPILHEAYKYAQDLENFNKGYDDKLEPYQMYGGFGNFGAGISWNQKNRRTMKKFKPTWDSLDSRKLPQWYDDAKFGIFVHWGVYSVPAFFSEWLWWHWKGDTPNKKVVDFMQDNYPGLSYQDLASQLTGKYFDADEIAKLVEDSGAKYFVFTSKHHEGFTHWKSDESWNWNSVDLGPKRDIIDELREAFIARDKVKFGLYFSLYEWFNPWYKKDKENNFETNEFIKKKVTPQILDLVKKYKPNYIWSDGDWEAHSDYWNSTNFLAWLYNESPVRDHVVVNDRWGKDATCKHGDVKTCKDRYTPGEKVSFKWENAMTIDKDCWGYRKEAGSKNYYTTAELIKILIETVSYGGNLLMNIGPTAEGRIIPIFEDRLRGIGEWLKTNGEAIYGTRQWRVQQERRKNGLKKRKIWYTQNGDVVYAMITIWPTSQYLYLYDPEVQPGTKIKLLGYDEDIMYQTLPERGLKINIDRIRLGKLVHAHAWTFKLQNIE